MKRESLCGELLSKISQKLFFYQDTNGTDYYKSPDQMYDSYLGMLLELAVWILPSLEVMLDLFTDHKDVSE